MWNWQRIGSVNDALSLRRRRLAVSAELVIDNDTDEFVISNIVSSMQPLAFRRDIVLPSWLQQISARDTFLTKHDTRRSVYHNFINESAGKKIENRSAVDVGKNKCVLLAPTHSKPNDIPNVTFKPKLVISTIASARLLRSNRRRRVARSPRNPGRE